MIACTTATYVLIIVHKRSPYIELFHFTIFSSLGLGRWIMKKREYNYFFFFFFFHFAIGLNKHDKICQARYCKTRLDNRDFLCAFEYLCICFAKWLKLMVFHIKSKMSFLSFLKFEISINLWLKINSIQNRGSAEGFSRYCIVLSDCTAVCDVKLRPISLTIAVTLTVLTVD